MPKKKTKRKRHHHVLGIVKADKLDKISEIQAPILEPVATDEPVEVIPEDHVVVAVPKSLWSRLTGW